MEAVRESLQKSEAYETPEGEEWRVISYPNFRKSGVAKAWKYVSSWGRLLSDDLRVLEAPKGKGYCQTTLAVHVDGACGGMATVAVHRIVAYTFLGPPPSPYHTVDHVDRKRENNRVSNLVWADPQQQLGNREAASYVLRVVGGPTFTTLKSFAEYAGVCTSSLSSMLRQASGGDVFEVNEIQFIAEQIRREKMNPPSVCPRVFGVRRNGIVKEKRHARALAHYIDGATIADVSARMGIAERTVLAYLGKAAREANSATLARLAERLGLGDVGLRQTLRRELDALSVAGDTMDADDFGESYRRVVECIVPGLGTEWEVVRQTFRSICTMLPDE